MSASMVILSELIKELGDKISTDDLNDLNEPYGEHELTGPWGFRVEYSEGLGEYSTWTDLIVHDTNEDGEKRAYFNLPDCEAVNLDKVDFVTLTDGSADISLQSV